MQYGTKCPHFNKEGDAGEYFSLISFSLEEKLIYKCPSVSVFSLDLFGIKKN